MTNQTYSFQPISDADATELRARGGEVYVADQPHCFPCRQCLRDAEVGEELILVSHDPFDHDSPYRCASPVFIHRHECTITTETGTPDQLARRQLSVRSFDAADMMIDAAVINGQDLATTLTHFFADPTSTKAHIHNAGRGCWATTAVPQRS